MGMWEAEAVRIILGIISFFGLILNSMGIFVLFRCQISSKLTTSLMRSQVVIDCYACGILFISKAVGPRYSTPWETFNKILCYSWFRDNLFWLGAVMSVHNIVCISFDRLVAVVSPIFYKLHQRGLLIGCYIYLVSMSLFLFIPNCLRRRFVNSTCESEFAIDDIATFFAVQSYFWLFCNYMLPGLFIITCHAVVIRFVYQSPLNIHNEDGSTQRSPTGRRVKMLFITTATMASMLLLFHAYEAVRYLLSNVGLIDYASGSPQQQVGIGLIILTCTLNPVILISTTSTLRHFARSYVMKLLFRINVSRNMSSSVASVTEL
ncbi:unnamed protein product [Echinostoma caproni]|uniref:G_PROTEIN_RECEP_F1_2 domain-containing protein n=1 Tax=Echinostoma caproni TaxID=27848 RepID=A0A183AI43_9TREM|nr:unnamed protein product [Echinostoma caproni]